jgi:hypothetical protein
MYDADGMLKPGVRIRTRGFHGKDYIGVTVGKQGDLPVCFNDLDPGYSRMIKRQLSAYKADSWALRTRQLAAWEGLINKAISCAYCTSG